MPIYAHKKKGFVDACEKDGVLKQEITYAGDTLM